MPRRNVYSRFAKQQLEMRDYLALERTILSNERTLLSYSQHALTLAAAGTTTVLTLDAPILVVGGALLIVTGLGVGVLGVLRFRRVKRRLDGASPAETADVAATALSSSHAEKNEP